MNLPTGGADVPYTVIDVIYGFASVETNGDQGINPHDAFKGVKQQLWVQAQYLSGDAVLFCNFGIDKDIATYGIAGSGITNAMLGIAGAMTKTNIGSVATTKDEKVFSVWGYGTVVKLQPKSV